MSNTQIEMMNEFIKCYLVWCISSGKFDDDSKYKEQDDYIENFRFEVSNNWKESFDIIKFCEHAGTTAKEVIGDAETACLITGVIQEYYRNNFGDECMMPMKDFNCETLLRHYAYYVVNEIPEVVCDDWVEYIRKVQKELKKEWKKECLNLIGEIREIIKNTPCDEVEYVYHIRNRYEIIFETEDYSKLQRKFDKLQKNYDRNNGYLLATKSRKDDDDCGYEEMFEYEPKDLKPLCACGKDLEDIEDTLCYTCYGWNDCKECGKRFCDEELCGGCLEDKQNGVPLDCDKLTCCKCQIQFHPELDCWKFDVDTGYTTCSVCSVWETKEPLNDEIGMGAENIVIQKKRIVRKKTPPLYDV